MYCLFCDEPISLAPGNIFYRLRSGNLLLGHHGIEFEEDYFEDGSLVKWLCCSCADGSIGGAHLDEEFCVLCHQEFERDDDDTGCELLIRAEETLVRVGRTGVPMPHYKDAGHVHFLCAIDDWNLPLWSCQLERDVPCP